MKKDYEINPKIHDARQTKGVYIWEIAERYGVAESTMYRLLRHELPAHDQERIIQIINDIAENRHDSKTA